MKMAVISVTAMRGNRYNLFRRKDLFKMNYRDLFVACIFITAFGYGTSAQDLPGSKVEVVKNFEARLAEAHKIRLEPEPTVRNVHNNEFDYSVTEQLLPVEYPSPVINPINMKTDDLPEVFSGFAKAGFGYPLSPYLDAGYQFGNIGSNSLLARITHHSANDKNIENQRFIDNDILLKGTILTNHGFAVDAKASASIDQHFFYSYDRENISFTSEEVRNNLDLFDFGVKIYNGQETDTKLNYWIGADVYTLGNNFATRETGLDLDLGLTKWFGDNPLTIQLGTDLTRLKDTSISKLNNFYVNPTFSFGTSSVRAKLGARMATSDEEYSFFPDVELLFNLAGSNLSLFLGADGDLRKNNFKSLTDYNPFMVSELSEIRNSKYYDFYAGLKGIVSGLEFSMQAGYKPTSDLALFELNDDKLWTRFDVLYDTVNIAYFKGSIKGHLFPNFDISGSIVKNFYDTNKEDEAWYLPLLQANAGVSYLALGQKLRLKAEAYVTDPVKFKEQPIADEPNLLFDVSLAADFYFTKNVGAFVHLNNLASNKYRRWYGYPGYGLNVLGGVTVRF